MNWRNKSWNFYAFVLDKVVQGLLLCAWKEKSYLFALIYLASKPFFLFLQRQHSWSVYNAICWLLSSKKCFGTSLTMLNASCEQHRWKLHVYLQNRLLLNRTGKEIALSLAQAIALHRQFFVPRFVHPVFLPYNNEMKLKIQRIIKSEIIFITSTDLIMNRRMKRNRRKEYKLKMQIVKHIIYLNNIFVFRNYDLNVVLFHLISVHIKLFLFILFIFLYFFLIFIHFFVSVLLFIQILSTYWIDSVWIRVMNAKEKSSLHVSLFSLSLARALCVYPYLIHSLFFSLSLSLLFLIKSNPINWVM